ncbi:putative HTH-type transcriptional regulator YdeC [Acidithiobacillus thiooxidans ATCC 19377]|uniref:Putative HTH-type transcriptional regulator YdeC n=2 Tax=Acidithiobacillus thiooxidans TaxID=930 RepID=A0A543PZM5_ACITH|nr:putative HTH-type transcriptional regulator YdeC [Acidithiobacillus thiooxidans ATCC 19377]
MRDYEAPLLDRHSCSLGKTSLDIISRQIGSEKATLRYQSSQHTLFIELTDGLQYERRIQGKTTTVNTRRGMVSFRPAGTEVTGWSRGNGIMRYAALFVDTEEAASTGLPARWQVPTCIEDEWVWVEAQGLLRACESPDTSTSPFKALYLEGRVLALLAILADRFGLESQDRRAKRTDRRLKRALAFIHERTAGGYGLPELANAAHISQAQLVRLFKEALGTTPMAYVASQRLATARRLLMGTDIPISELAARFGYADQSHFTRQFRKATGTTPARFRKTVS